MFTSHETPVEIPRVDGLRVEPVEALETGGSKLDLNVLAIPGATPDADWSLVWEYSSDLFERSTITRMAGHYAQLLRSIAVHASRSVRELELLDTPERELLLSWPQNRRPYPRERSIHSLFAEQAARTPEAPALRYPGSHLTYADLDRRANQLARLLQAAGTGPGDILGVCLERSPDLIVSVLAILKAGAAYLPLDPGYPTERLRFVLQDARPRLVITNTDVPDRLPGSVPFVHLDREAAAIHTQSPDPVDVDTSADQLAYIMYTSGSTGTPKGVLVTHRGVVRLVTSADYVELGPTERVLQLAPTNFDAATFEIWGALLNGACLVICPHAQPTLHDLAECLRSERISTLWLTAGLFHELVDYQPSAFDGVRQVLTGGDVVSAVHVRTLARAVPTCRIIDGYGPTENTTFTACYTVEDPERIGGTVPIGRPIANTSVYALDDSQQLVPIGVPGELYAGGDGVARGYLNAPDLTAERFVPDPFAADASATLYRSGDRVRWLADGNLEFLGRLDDQLKVRGFRIEPGEIEACLNTHPGVRECVVVGQSERRHRRPVAYVVPVGGVPPTDLELRRHVNARLPEHMVPSAFVSLERLPLTPNGKVDRAALPEVASVTAPRPQDPAATPGSDLERRMTALWADVLEVSDIEPDDNFFDLGGHSLLAVRLFGLIEREFGVELPLSSLFPSASVREVAAAVRASASPSGAGRVPAGSLVPLNKATQGVPLFLVHPLDGDVLRFSRLATLLGDAGYPVYGVRARGLEPGEEALSDVAAIAAEYGSLLQAAQPNGPFQLAGFSSGGLLAYATAAQLRADGKQVAFLGMLDSRCPMPVWQPWHARLRQLRRDLAVYARYALQPEQRTHLLRRQAAELIASSADRLRPRAARPERLLDQIVNEIGEFSERHLAVARAHRRAILAYRLLPYAGHVSLFRSRVQLLLSDHDPWLGWGHLARDISVYAVPGRHEDMFKPPYVQDLALALTTALQGSRADERTR
jgi:amino acid adenylation domain-containing protein